MKIITPEVIEGLMSRAAVAARKRTNLNLHEDYSDPINRFLNVGLAGTYVRPHRHQIGKWEIACLLQGRVDIIIFTPAGKIESRTSLCTGGACLAEIPGGSWHTFLFQPPAAAVLEVKPGPYEPDADKEFAEWAPPEGSPAAPAFNEWLQAAAVGTGW